MDSADRIEFQDRIAKRIRAVVLEHGESALKDGATIVSCNDYGPEICGLPHIYAPTLGGEHLGNVEFKVARHFEDAV